MRINSSATLFFNLLTLVITAVWAGQTMVIDFFVIPKVFQTIPDMFLAGELGSVVFGNFNKLEFLSSCLLFISCILGVKYDAKARWGIPLSILLMGIAGTYFFYLTNKIKELTVLWQYAEQTGQIASPGIPDIQQEHQFYHRFYVTMDVIKLCLLLIFTGLQTLILCRKPQVA